MAEGGIRFESDEIPPFNIEEGQSNETGRSEEEQDNETGNSEEEQDNETGNPKEEQSNETGSPEIVQSNETGNPEEGESNETRNPEEEQSNETESSEEEQNNSEQRQQEDEEIEELLDLNPEKAFPDQREIRYRGNTITYCKRKGTSPHGQLNELRMIMFIFLKLINKGYPFYMCSNLDGAGDFDDIVVKYTKKDKTEKTEKTLFIQLKHVENDDTEKSVSFVEKEPFLELHKYFTSFCNGPVFEDSRYKNFFSNALYLIITNATLKHDGKVENTWYVCSDSQKKIEEIYKVEKYEIFFELLKKANEEVEGRGGRGGYTKSLLKEIRQETTKNNKLKHIFYQISNVLETMNKLENIKGTKFNEFISRTRILRKLTNNNALDKGIKEEIKKALGIEISSVEIESVFGSLYDYISKWHLTNYYLTENWIEWQNIKERYGRRN